jgi:hypothetical protein
MPQFDWLSGLLVRVCLSFIPCFAFAFTFLLIGPSKTLLFRFPFSSFLGLPIHEFASQLEICNYVLSQSILINTSGLGRGLCLSIHYPRLGVRLAWEKAS